MRLWRANMSEEDRNEYRRKNAERRRRWYATQDGKRKQKDNALRAQYGITLDQYERMADEQGGNCRICESALDLGFYTAVDHDHDTGRVRGLLCSKCNMALGAFKDSAALLERAIDYLTKDRTDQ
jgi:hypothetical protein